MASNKVLFISAPIGSGHIRAAQAVSHMLKMTHPTCQSEICNVFDFLNPVIGQTILKTYLKILNIFPQAYGSMYNWGNQSHLALFGRELISKFLAGQMVDYINKFQPSVIVCTHATPAGLVAWSKKKGLLAVPAVAVITDFVAHRLWIYPELDRYFVAHEGMIEYLSKQGIARQFLSVTGIPVNYDFSQPGDRMAILKWLKLDGNKKTILLMGGGGGLLPMEEILQACMASDRPMQFIAIAGNNSKLYQSLSRLALTARHPVRVLGFIDNIREVMGVADLLISKPGGMSSSEALAIGVPLIIYRPIPGQEEANTRYLLEKRAALRADSLNELMTVLGNLLAEGCKELRDLRYQATSIGRPNAAKNIAESLVNNYFF
ncbi:glycosyltransferase [Sporomusa aerivorans]|uniref:MGDG synthase family glycosyltransferase n=1 Tax=Sporomusa aerivorans TaxID=204936 RepID=UPI00352ADAF8